MNVEVQDAQLQGLQVTPDRLRLEMAAGLYASEEVTLGQATAIAGLSQTKFVHELGRRGICIHYGVAEFEQDLETLETQPGGAGNPKPETRNPKEIRRPKSENRSPQGG